VFDPDPCPTSSRKIHGQHNDPQRQHPESKNWKETQQTAGTKSYSESNAEIAGLGEPDLETGKVRVMML
jgi:hypothetical protein